MMIYVEGADGSGKSTLTKALGERYPTVYVSRTAQDRYPAFWSKLDFHVADTVDVVADRCPISDYVYRMLDGEKGTYSINDLIPLLRTNLVIYCRTATQWEDAIARGEDNITDPSDAAIIDITYKFLMKLLEKEGVEIIEYNWKKDSLDELLAKIKTRRVKV